MTATKSYTADNIINLADEMKAVPAILSGVLDEKIATARTLIADLQKRQGIVDTIEKANAVVDKTKADIDAHRQEAQDKISAQAYQANALLKAATEKMAAADIRDRETADGMAKLVVARNQFSAAQKSAQDEINAKLADIDQNVTVINGRKNELDAAEKKLKQDQATVNARLEALKV